MIFLSNNLIFKHFVLKRIKQKHYQLWEGLGSPKVLNMKESLWVLIGFSHEINIRKTLIDEVEGSKTIMLLNRYRVSTIFEVFILFIAIVFLFWK